MIENRNTYFETDKATAVEPLTWEPPHAPLDMPRQVLEDTRETKVSPLLRLFFPQRA